MSVLMHDTPETIPEWQTCLNAAGDGSFLAEKVAEYQAEPRLRGDQQFVAEVEGAFARLVTAMERLDAQQFTVTVQRSLAELDLIDWFCEWCERTGTVCPEGHGGTVRWVIAPVF